MNTEELEDELELDLIMAFNLVQAEVQRILEKDISPEEMVIQIEELLS